MKGTFFPALLITLFSALASSGYGQNAPNFEANLDGLHALPPNNSPLRTSASIYGPEPFLFPPFTHTIYIWVEFPRSLFTNDPNVFPDIVSLQRQDGAFVTDPYCEPDPCPLILTALPGPQLPCGPTPNDFPCQPSIPIVFADHFALLEQQVNELVMGQWYVNATFINSNGTPLPEYTIRGQIVQFDADSDGVADYRDACLGTEPGMLVDANGCSVEQLCPCEGPWRNHKEYVKCVKDESQRFRKARLITERERQAIVNRGERSACGIQIPRMPRAAEPQPN